ncbi:transposase family protein [Actinacidiphila glaucinigra]|uniref:transposase family protein n=1 Tax=Actinacidiphila glaucinigra TaxID=235986 RepID=UPI003D94B5D0
MRSRCWSTALPRSAAAVGNQRADCSGKQRRHGVNLQVITDPRGKIRCIFPGPTGRSHDPTAGRTHRIVTTCVRLGLCPLADLSYRGARRHILRRADQTPIPQGVHRPDSGRRTGRTPDSATLSNLAWPPSSADASSVSPAATRATCLQQSKPSSLWIGNAEKAQSLRWSLPILSTAAALEATARYSVGSNPSAEVPPVTCCRAAGFLPP